MRRNAVCTVFLEYRSSIDNVVYIPFAWLTHSVCQRRSLLVHTTCLTVYVCFVVIAVQNLNFVHVLQENTTVTTTLASTCNVSWHAPFKVKLEAFERFLCQDITLLLVYSKYAIVYIPFCWATLCTFPCRKILTVKQYDSIRWSTVCLDTTRSNYLWLWSPIFRHTRSHSFLFRILLFLCVCTYAN